jgi:DNA end-binding protein Ku
LDLILVRRKWKQQRELILCSSKVENLTTEKFDPGQYSDTYAQELEKLIEAKSKGQEIVHKQEEEEPEETRHYRGFES